MDNEDAIVPALVLFHEWLRERLITQEGADPLGDSADTVAEFMSEVIGSAVAVVNDLLDSFSGIFNA